jgi:hypothetical protein
MQNKTGKKTGNEKSDLVGENIQSGHGEQRESSDIEIVHDEKIPVEIRDIIRIYAKDFSVLKESYMRWAKQWE